MNVWWLELEGGPLGAGGRAGKVATAWCGVAGEGTRLMGLSPYCGSGMGAMLS